MFPAAVFLLAVTRRLQRCQAFVNQAINGIGPSLAFGGFHHLSSEGIFAFVVAGFDLGDNIRIRGQHFVHFGDDRAVVRYGGEAFGVYDGLGSWPVANISSRTAFAVLFVILPLSRRVISSRRFDGVTLLSVMSWPEAFSSRARSPVT